jgi:hypothetical protein
MHSVSGTSFLDKAIFLNTSNHLSIKLFFLFHPAQQGSSLGLLVFINGSLDVFQVSKKKAAPDIFHQELPGAGINVGYVVPSDG